MVCYDYVGVVVGESVGGFVFEVVIGFGDDYYVFGLIGDVVVGLGGGGYEWVVKCCIVWIFIICL